MLKSITPRDYQSKVAPRVFDYLRRHKQGHPLAALPTASGKTVVIADVIDQILDQWSGTEIIVLSHVKEILQQDYNMLSSQLDIDIGLNSSGLNRRDYSHQVTVAGIQSVYRNPELFKRKQFAIIDEAHLIPPSGNGMYQKFLGGLPKARYFGLTATPFRLGSGYIYGPEGDKIFDSLVYDLTSMESFNDLVKRGYLSKLVTKATKLEMATDDLHIRGGDFIDKEMSVSFDKPGITNKALDEVVKFGKDYKKWLIFAIDIDHAEHIAENLLQRGIPTGVIHSKMEMNRARILDLYRSDKLRCIVNVNVLTTGFDHPGIDLIALLRPTCSPVIHVQTVGRGLRVADGKDHCLVLDFAGNTARLGPINDIHIKEKRRKGDEPGEPITKTCPECDTICHPTTKLYPVCGFEFKFKVGISVTAGTAEIVKEGGSKWYDVDHVSYSLHEKANAPASLLVRYNCGLHLFKEWICIEHNGYAGHKARGWVKYRFPEVPDIALTTAAELLSVADELNKPIAIKVDNSKKYPTIIDYKFNSV